MKNIAILTKPLAAALCCLLLSNCYAEADAVETLNSETSVHVKPSVNTNANVMWPRTKTQVPSDEERINEILTAMSIEDKVGQLVMAETRHVSPADVKRYRLGGILNGGGSYPNNNKKASAADWVALSEAFYQASIDRKDGAPKIPVIWGTDAVHGANNVFGATIFPHNIGLGATRNPELMKKIGHATAKEVVATGIYWTLDDRWGRTYEGFSEDPELVAELSAAMIQGLQGKLGDNFLGEEHVVATAKHFIGDGGTHKGKDQGNTRLNEAALSKWHAQGYFTALDEGVQTVMATFNSWNGKKVHGDEYLLTEVLKNQMGFDGFVVGDWNGHGQVAGCTNDNCAQSVNAGVDMIMVPEDWEAFYKNTLKQARSGKISEQRLNDAVRRILRVKLRMGLFDKGGPKRRPLAGKQELIGHAEHRAIARQAVSESLVLLKNNNQVLPLKAGSNILVAGEAANSIANQLGGWSLTWQGTETSNSDFPGATRIVDAIKSTVEKSGGTFTFNANGQYQTKPDTAIVIISEPPYAEGPGDRGNLAFSPENRKHMALLRKLQADDIEVVTIFLSGRAMWVNPELNASDAFVAAWLPGTEGQGVSDVLFCNNNTNCDFKGRLAFSWPKDPSQSPLNLSDSIYNPLFKLGYGLSYAKPNVNLDKLSEKTDALSQSYIGKTLFKGRGIAPFSAVIQEQGLQTVSASESPSSTKNNGVVATVFDRKLQEDALRIEFNGSGLNSWQLQSSEKINWEKEASSGALLAFDVKVKQVSEQPIYASLVCGSGCNGSLPLADTIKQTNFKEWQTLGVSLSCFEKFGADLANVTHPLVLLTPGNWALEIADVRVVGKETAVTSYSCP